MCTHSAPFTETADVTLSRELPSRSRPSEQMNKQPFRAGCLLTPVLPRGPVLTVGVFCGDPAWPGELRPWSGWSGPREPTPARFGHSKERGAEQRGGQATPRTPLPPADVRQ